MFSAVWVTLTQQAPDAYHINKWILSHEIAFTAYEQGLNSYHNHLNSKHNKDGILYRTKT